MLHYLTQTIAPAARRVSERVILQNVSRRTFLKGTAWGTGAVFAATILPFNTAKAFETYPHGGLDMPNGIVNNPHVFVSIAPDGTVPISERCARCCSRRRPNSGASTRPR
jgi:isoquinoline 1-oxidoreductase subunit beta